MNKIDQGVCNHFYHGSTDPRDHTWLLTIEAMIEDPNPEKTAADEQKRANQAAITEDTLIQGVKWETRKHEAMGEFYEQANWWKMITNYEKLILARLKEKQTA